MTGSNKYKVIILGSGPSGLTAAIYTARANLNPLVIQGQLPGGQLTTTTEIENFPGFEDGIFGAELMEKMTKQAQRFGAELLMKYVTKVDFSKKPFKIYCEQEEFQADAVIISTGATPRMLGLDEEKSLLGFGLSTCATCDGAFFNNQEIVVVGGGDSACEEAIFLTRFGKRVRLIHRRDELRASKIMADRVKANPKIEIIWNSGITKLLSDKTNSLYGAIIKNLKTNEETTIECAAVFYAIGHKPNTDLFHDILELDENGYLITEPEGTKTNVAGIFACGDVQDHKYRQAITAAGSGCMAAIECARYLEENE
ncbi:MAG: thioredoxin-disulfide reductase [Deltaproteobacteria bacterium]|nr:thioredoxin-disulfide reductase [Deltaproteobacteria bacterium]